MVRISRRSFLKIGGVAALGLMAKPILDLLAKEEATDVLPRRESVKALPEGALVERRWAMVIDLKACLAKEGCRDCINACHSIHNVPVLPTLKEEIRWIWILPYENAFGEHEEFIREDLKHLPTIVMCNQCGNPACIQVCPTRATWRREDGIVMMDFHRCIGCRFCMAACPYGSRSFNWRDPRPFIPKINPEFPTRTKGVVEKCNFCEERLAIGKLPACVEACKQNALIFGDLEDPASEVRKVLKERFSRRRKPELGTDPSVFYLIE